MYVVPSLNYPNTYFIFRDDGTEVKVSIENNLLRPSKPLTPDESNEMAFRYLRHENDLSFDEKVIKKHLVGEQSEERIAQDLNSTRYRVGLVIKRYWNKKKLLTKNESY